MALLVKPKKKSCAFNRHDPLSSIRNYCWSVCMTSREEVRQCPDSGCPLYLHRIAERSKNYAARQNRKAEAEG